jgi:hypothetical protein
MFLVFILRARKYSAQNGGNSHRALNLHLWMPESTLGIESIVAKMIGFAGICSGSGGFFSERGARWDRRGHLSHPEWPFATQELPP